ncbi:hypothetical protein [Tistrella mobilis]|uniref:hypothetical protein n=1 Tax=Tistrella mobilis TaxID=171437 RepID=UPI0035570FA1
MLSVSISFIRPNSPTMKVRLASISDRRPICPAARAAFSARPAPWPNPSPITPAATTCQSPTRSSQSPQPSVAS